MTQTAKERIEREKAEAEEKARQEALRPDKEKLESYARALLKDDDALEILNNAFLEVQRISNRGRYNMPEPAVTTDIEKFEGRNVQIDQSSTPPNILEYAIQKNLTPEQIEKFWEIQQKIDRANAEKAAIEDLARFKSEDIYIIKDKTNQQFGSKYASVESLVRSVVPLLSKHNFSHRWDYAERENGNLVVTCILTHALGHSFSVSADGPPDVGRQSTKGNFAKNDLQAKKSTRTYLRAETFEAVTGLASEEACLDDDGNASGKAIKYIDERQISTLTDLINAHGAPEKQWLDWIKAESIDKIPAKHYNKMVTALQEGGKKK